MGKNKVVLSEREGKRHSFFIGIDPMILGKFTGIRGYEMLIFINIIYNKSKGLGMEVFARGATRSTPHP
jgi:hypothetical protein